MVSLTLTIVFSANAAASIGVADAATLAAITLLPRLLALWLAVFARTRGWLVGRENLTGQVGGR